MRGEAIRTGEIKPLSRAIVDYIAEGELRSGNDRIPCEIGYTKSAGLLIAEYIFIKRDGVNANGNHYNKEIVYLMENNSIFAYDEEA